MLYGNSVTRERYLKTVNELIEFSQVFTLNVQLLNSSTQSEVTFLGSKDLTVNFPFTAATPETFKENSSD